METGNNVNGTDAVNYNHPCYEINHLSYKFKTPPSAVCVMLCGFLTLLSVVTVCGNLLVIISVLYFNQLHTPTNFLILSLAVVDLLVGSLVLPLSIVFSLSICLQFGGFFCKMRDSFDIMLSTCSLMHLCCISVDRYFAVCQPLTYKCKISRQIIFIMIAVSWGVSVFIGIGVVTLGTKNEQCDKTCLFDVVLTNIVGPIFSFYVPVFIILCIYMKIFLVAQKQARRIQTKMKCGATVSKMERKATKTLATVLGVFLFCWSPFYLCFAFLTFSNRSVPVVVSETLNWLALSNSMLNPFIYAFFYSWFRSAFKIIMSGKILHSDFANTKLH